MILLTLSIVTSLAAICSSSATRKESKMEENTNFKKKRTVMIAMDGSKHSEYAFKCKNFDHLFVLSGLSTIGYSGLIKFVFRIMTLRS